MFVLVDSMMKKIKENRLSIFGIFLIIFSIIIELLALFQNYLFANLIKFVASSQITTIISSSGVALVLIALIESRYLMNSLKSTSEKIVYESSNKLDEKLENTFELIRNCKYNGLLDILPPRQDWNKFDITRNTIADEITKAKYIYIFGISGSDFFDFPKGARSGGGMYHSIILQRIEDAKQNNKKLDLYIKALLMNPNCEVAKFRNQIEEIEFSQGNVRDDVNTSIEGINKINKNISNEDNSNYPLIDYRLYSIFPQMGFILTDTCVFVEPYHFAPTKNFCNSLKANDLPAAEMENICTGGRVPVFKFQFKSNMYVAMKMHFDSMWKYTEHGN